MYNGQNEYVPYKKWTKLRWTITECACCIRPGNSVTCPVVDNSQLRSNRHQRIHTGYLQDAERMRTWQTAWESDRPHTNAWVKFIHRTYLSGGVHLKFWPCPKLANGSDRTKQISPDTERIQRMANGQASGHQRTENFTVRYTSVSAIR